jgi:catechol-2,3-dioxygenase
MTDHTGFGGICELTLEAADLPALERFYRDVLGLELLGREADRVWLACGRHARLGLWSAGSKEYGDRGGRHVHYALSAAPEHFDAIVERLESAAVAYQGPVVHPGRDRSIYVDDPEGNVVELWDFFEHGDGARDGVAALVSGSRG